jgi:hypothetical protein
MLCHHVAMRGHNPFGGICRCAFECVYRYLWRAGMYRYYNETIIEGTWSSGHRHGEGIYRTRCVACFFPSVAVVLRLFAGRTNAVYKENTDSGRVLSRTRIK